MSPQRGAGDIMSESGDIPDIELLRGRRSIRRFKPDPLPDPLLERILQAATWAPSAHNRQPWRFVVLRTPESRVCLSAEMGAVFRTDLLSDGWTEEQAAAQVDRSNQRIREAPAAVLVCLDVESLDVYPDNSRQQYEYLMGVQSVAMAGQNLLLAAGAEGLGGVWMCAPLFVPQTVQRVLNLPQNWAPQGLVLLGYPAKVPPPGERLALAEVTRYC